VHARNAALMALSVTSEYFTDEDCACRLIPVISPLLIDKEKPIRDQALKTMDVYMQKIRKAAAGMPDSALPADGAGAGAVARMGAPQPEASGGAVWAGWAISSFTNKLSAAAGEITASGSAAGTETVPPKRPATATPTTTSTSSASALHRQAVKSPPPSAPLTRNPSSAGAGSGFGAGGETFFPEDDADEDADAWGDMGDMDDGDDDGTAAANDDNPFAEKSTPPKKKTVESKPFDDGSEPDFAGWLAQQAEKKKAGGIGAGGKALPKGLAKSGSGAGAAASTVKKTATPAVKKTPIVAKKKVIDTGVKDDGGDGDDGWGGW